MSQSGGLPHPAPSQQQRQAGKKWKVPPSEWRVELPTTGMSDAKLGGCRSIDLGYTRVGPLGSGTYGEVFKAQDLAVGEMVAVKKIKMDNEKEGFPITAIREIKILSELAVAADKLDGKDLKNNVIRLREIVRSNSHRANAYKGSIYMVFDYMNHDMAGLLERCKLLGHKMEVAQCKTYLKQLFCGLALLQAKEVLHRDLKNANLLVSNKGELKIADFGLARYFMRGASDTKADEASDGTKPSTRGPSQDPKMTNRVITLWYRPPELLLGAERYGPEIDAWSAGCIMFELLAGRPLFPGIDDDDQLHTILKVMGQPTEISMPGSTSLPKYNELKINRYPKTSELRKKCEINGIRNEFAIALLSSLLELNPKKRISAKDAATDDWFYNDPRPLPLDKMPSYEESHEAGMKEMRREQKIRDQQPLQQQQTAAMVAGVPLVQPQYHHQQQQHMAARGGGGGGYHQPHYQGGVGHPPMAQYQHHQHYHQQQQQMYAAGSGGGGGYAGGGQGGPPPSAPPQQPPPPPPPPYYPSNNSSQPDWQGHRR
jgi:cyclin-dependent kinase 12/13